MFTIGSLVEKTGGTITEPTEFDIGFTPAGAGALRATLDAASGNATDEQSTIISVAEQPKEETEPQGQQTSESGGQSAANAEQQPSSQQGTQTQQSGSCPLPLVILTISFIGIAIRR